MSEKHILKCSVAVVAVAGALAASVSASQAGGFALREQSAIGQGASFAGVAAGGSLSSMYWNPATLTQVGGVNVESVFTGVIPETEVKNLSSTQGTVNPGNVGLSALIPASYNGAQLTDDLFVGLSVNAPYGLATKAKNPSATSFHSATAEIFTTDVKANVAYRINEAFSVGAALGIAYGKVRMTGTPPALAGRYSLEGDDWAPTFSVGATFKPTDTTTIGVGYRSQTRFKLSGTEGSVLGNRDITAQLNLPAMVTVGLRQEITEKFRMMAGFEWTEWSSVKDPVPIVGSHPLINKTLHLGYEDSWYVSVGGEYDYSDELTVRAGLGYEKSPIPTEHRNLRLPDANRVWASVGASYEVTDKIGVDFGYSHLFVKDDVAVKGNVGTDNYTATANSSVDILSASLRYQWKPEPLFAGDDPIDRKY